MALQDEGRKTPCGHRDCQQQEQTLALVSCREAAYDLGEQRRQAKELVKGWDPGWPAMQTIERTKALTLHET